MRSRGRRLIEACLASGEFADIDELSKIEMLDVTPSAVAPSHAATFTASADPAGSAVISYSWTFDDGQTATGAEVSHAFSTAGRHTASVLAMTAGGSSTTVRTTVLVDGTAPVITFGSVRHGVLDLTATDGLSGLLRMTATIDGNPVNLPAGWHPPSTGSRLACCTIGSFSIKRWVHKTSRCSSNI